MTQEEFEDIVNKTCEMFLNYRPKEAVAFWKENGEGEIIVDSDLVWSLVYFNPFDTNLKFVKKWMPDTNAHYLSLLTLSEDDFREECSMIACDCSCYDQALMFATSDLNVVKKLVLVENNDPNELFSENLGYSFYSSPWFLLVNPRKDVVEWALKTFDFKSQTSELNLIKDRQAIPELKELIFQSLQSPINQ